MELLAEMAELMVRICGVMDFKKVLAKEDENLRNVCCILSIATSGYGHDDSSSQTDLSYRGSVLVHSDCTY